MAVRFLPLILAGVFAFGNNEGFAQSSLDPSAALLLAQPPVTTAKPEKNVDATPSSRYVTRQKSSSSNTRRVESLRNQSAASKADPNEPLPVTEGDLEGQVITPGKDGILKIPPPVVTVSSDQTEGVSAAASAENSGAPKMVLRFGTGVEYFGAQSDYWIRNQNATNLQYSIGGTVWFSPEWGISIGSRSSLLGTGTSQGASQPVTESVLVYGLERRFEHFRFIFEAIESKFEYSEASASLQRVNTKSTGFQIGVQADINSTANSELTLGFKISPKMTHEESSAGGTLKSGSSAEAYAISANISKSWIYANQKLTLTLDSRLERDRFSGQSSQVDPVSGLQPSHVGVTESKTLIQFGYEWNN